MFDNILNSEYSSCFFTFAFFLLFIFFWKMIKWSVVNLAFYSFCLVQGWQKRCFLLVPWISSCLTLVLSKWTYCIFVVLSCYHICPRYTLSLPLKTSENRNVFWCFQGVEKGCIGNKWVKANFHSVNVQGSFAFLTSERSFESANFLKFHWKKIRRS